jgi:hypothetical protein
MLYLTGLSFISVLAFLVDGGRQKFCLVVLSDSVLERSDDTESDLFLKVLGFFFLGF